MWRALMGGAVVGAVGAMCLGSVLVAAPSQSLVADAAMQKDDAAVQQLLQQGADVNAAQADGMTALHWAAINDDAKLVDLLSYAGADVHASTRMGAYTPLDLAARDGHADVVSALLAHGANAKAADSHGTTPLMFAAESGSVPAIEALVKAGADVNAKESTKGETALMFAAAYGRLDAVNALLAHGADWRVTSTIIDWTKVKKNDPRFVKDPQVASFSQKQANAQVAQPQQRQAFEGSAAAATPAGVGHATPEPAGKDSARNKPSKPAVHRMSYAELVGTQGGITALMLASRQGHLDIVESLVKAGADVNEVDPGDKTSPLVIAIINGRFDVATYLLDHGANPNLAQANGVTPLYAVLNCEWHAKSEFPFPLAYMQQKTTYLQLMQALLDHGADPNARLTKKVWYSNYNDDQSGIDEAGATPFWRAAYADDIEAMKLLVAHGADPNIPTKKESVTGSYAPTRTDAKDDKSGLPPVPPGGPDIPPLLAASGEAYGSSFTANHHRYAPTGMLSAVKYLVEVLHADVNARDAEGNTALHNAASRGDNEMVLYLVSKGANVGAINRKGQTVADMANGPFQRTQPYPETIALLQKLGARIMNKCVSC